MNKKKNIIYKMFIGKWNTEMSYKKGDVIKINKNEYVQYFVCSRNHTSDQLMYPNMEDIYWIHIHESLILHLKSHKVVIELPGPPGTPVTVTPEIDVNCPLKRKIRDEEQKVVDYKKSRSSVDLNEYKNRIMLLNTSIATKTFILDKYEAISKMSSSDHSKGINWLNTVLNIPFGKYKTNKESLKCVKSYFKNVKAKLDLHVHGLEDIKQDILEFIARKVSNPDGKGYVLALHGAKGTGKSKICRSLAEAMDLPFHQINFGGLNDVSILNGHSETYVGSKPGKIVEILTEAGCMNGIIMLDEVDKISDTRHKEINGILTHLLDEEQNTHFQDTFIGNVPIDLSKVLFVIAFNDIDKMDDIVLDRMKVIHVSVPSIEDKLVIAKTKMIPEICKTINFDKKSSFIISDELLYDIIIKKTENEVGVRKLKKLLETIFNKLNYYLLLEKSHPGIKCRKRITTIHKSFIDECIFTTQENQAYLSMYV
jgi:ATP-dependent Lon protease